MQYGVLESQPGVNLIRNVHKLSRLPQKQDKIWISF